jgi:RNA polymerase sigma-70 factor (ECF subfamily)
LIAAFHATAATASDTDWVGIARSYRRLEHLTGSPIVRLNRAVAVGEAYGAPAGLAMLRAAGERLPGNHRVALVRAELLARDGRSGEAHVAYRQALAAAPEGPERRHIRMRLEQLDP